MSDVGVVLNSLLENGYAFRRVAWPGKRNPKIIPLWNYI